MTSNAAERRLAEVLRDFSPGESGDPDQLVWRDGHRVDLGFFHDEGVLLYLLVKKIGAVRYGPEEKLHWGAAFRYCGRKFSIEQRKASLRLVGIPAAPTDDEAEPILRALLVGTRLIEDEVRALAAQRVREGRVTVPNRLEGFDEGWRFFCDRARAKFDAMPTVPTRLAGDSREELQEALRLSESARALRHEGAHYASAGIGAWFSRLEHLLVLMRPFISPRLAGEEIITFMGDGWGEKFNSVFNPASSPVAAQIKGKLTDVKESYRNAVEHGGHAKNGAALYFHDETMGATPVWFSRKDRAPRLTWSSVGETDLTRALETFDEFEKFVAGSVARFGLRWAQSGLSVAYDEESVAAYLAAQRSDDEFDAFIAWTQRMEDRAADADY